MNTPAIPSVWRVMRAAASREWLSHRLNRFLYAHVLLVVVAGMLPLLTAGDAFARGAIWWLLHAVLYAVSLSALLLGFSSAQAEVDELVWLQGQPRGLGPWLAGKVSALVMLVGTTTAVLTVPTTLAGGGSAELLLLTAGAAGVAAVAAVLGLAIGSWVRDSVRGLIAVVGLWFALVFGADLVLLGTAGAPWIQAHPDVWVAPLMLNPVDAFRVTVLFAVERAAFSGIDGGQLTSWWVQHAPLWLGVLLAGWAGLGGVLAWRGANRRVDA